MTAHSGTQNGQRWQLAPCLIAMEVEADELAPGRSKASDGTIGDAAHQARQSDHNPANGFVHALDLTDSPATGWDATARLHQITNRIDKRLKYGITDGEIWTPERGWHTYIGPDSHYGHSHQSCFDDPALRGDMSQWWPAISTPPAPTLHDLITLCKLTVLTSAGPNSPDALKVARVGFNRWFADFAKLTHQPDPPDLPITPTWDQALADTVILWQRITKVNELGQIGPGTWNGIYDAAHGG